MLHKAFGLDVKAVTDEGAIEGYASVFGGSPDAYGDIIAPGAFSQTLTEHKRAGTMPLMLWGHDASQPPIGGWSDMAEDGKGLWVQGQIDLEDPMGQRVYRGLKAKRMKGLSIGYEARDSENDQKRGVRILKDVKLWEVSPVNFPAQTRAAVDTVKSYTRDGALPSHTDFDELLREAGFSKSQRSVILGKGYLHLLRSESGTADEEAAEFFRALRS